MSTQTKKKIATSQIKALHNLILDSISDKKGQKTVSIDLVNVDDAIADYFIICEADNMPQIKAIADNVSYRVKQELGELPSQSEGKTNLEWVLIDYFDIVVHIFYKDKRQFYELEELWSDGVITEYEFDA